jgi:hydroxypyruvate reductase
MSNTQVTINKMRQDAALIFQAGIDAANPYQAVKHCLFATDNHIEIFLDPDNPNIKRTGNWEKIHLVAFGKAACMMAKAAQEIIPAEMLAEKGIAVTNYENEMSVNHFDVYTAGHPLPDLAGLNAAKIIAERAKKARQNELVLVLVSGGGSALVPYPVDGISLDEKIAATELLLASGATINQINCVRKHLSQLKGGGLARMTAPADLHALILSDVLGDDLSAIASGPTIADESTFADAIAVFQSKKIWHKLPENIKKLLEKGVLNKIAETPKPNDSIFVHTGHTLIGSNTISVKAIEAAAKKLNYDALLYSDQLTGESRDEAEKLVIYTKELIDRGIDKPLALLAGGETTVTLMGKGRGGRNQEMALAFAIAARQHHLPDCWVFLSGGTDGIDGPTDAAGGLIDPSTYQRITDARLNPVDGLAENDSYTVLKKAHDLLDIGATGTNVADLQVLLIQP